MTGDPNHPAVAVGVVLLAAGAASRMGKPKMLLPWGTTSVLGHSVEQWRRLYVKQIAVVCAAEDGAVAGELDRLSFPREGRIVNPTPALGMFSSIQCASNWTGWQAGLTHWIITLGDQPHLRSETLGALLDFGAAHSQAICQLSRDGRPRHPVWLPQRIFAELPEAAETDLRQFLENRSACRVLCASADSGLDYDLDTPADYERLVRLFLKR